MPSMEQPSDEPLAHENAALWMTRTHRPDGTDSLTGSAVAEFAAGEKHGTLHLAFCPPFRDLPQVDCELADPVDVRLKVAAVYPYGVRIELKRMEASAEAGTVRIEFAAHTGGSLPAAGPSRD